MARSLKHTLESEFGDLLGGADQPPLDGSCSAGSLGMSGPFSRTGPITFWSCRDVVAKYWKSNLAFSVFPDPLTPVMTK